MVREYEKITCPGCGRTISAYVPHMGDGSALRMVRHKPPIERNGMDDECSLSGRLVEPTRDYSKWKQSL